MSTLSLITTLAVLLIIIGLFVWAFFGRRRDDLTNLPGVTMNMGIWSMSTDVAGGSRNQCSVYKFPTVINSDGTVTLAEPTYNRETLDALPPSSPSVGQCIQPDEVIAQQQIHQCLNDTCVGNDGKIYAAGEKEVFYQACGSYQPCKFNYGVVALGFVQDEAINSRCLTVRNGQVVTAPCNTVTGQLLNIYRTNDLSTLDYDESGTFMRIEDPQSNQCIVPEQGSGFGRRLILGDCAQGFVWGYSNRPYTFGGNIIPPQVVYLENPTQAEPLIKNSWLSYFTSNPNAQTMRTNTSNAAFINVRSMVSANAYNGFSYSNSNVGSDVLDAVFSSAFVGDYGSLNNIINPLRDQTS